MKTTKLSQLQNSGYYGIDASIDISLFEYGLLVKPENNEFHVFYAVGSNTGMEYDTFDCGWITYQEINELANDLSDTDSRSNFFTYTGIDKDTWINDNNWVIKLYDLLSYFGYQNIFGDSYNSFEIVNDL